MKIYDALGDAGLLGNVSFGLVAFRDSPQAVPALKLSPGPVRRPRRGRNLYIGRVEATVCSVSQPDFIEDSFAR